jgi:hypothetical protein
VALKSTELRPIMTRIPEGLRKRLERSARVADRSMNSEIIHRLMQSYEKEEVSEALMSLLGGDDNAKTLRALVRVLLAHGGASENWWKYWRANPVAAEAVHRSVDLLMADLTGRERAFPPMTAEDFAARPN